MPLRLPSNQNVEYRESQKPCTAEYIGADNERPKEKKSEIVLNPGSCHHVVYSQLPTKGLPSSIQFRMKYQPAIATIIPLTSIILVIMYLRELCLLCMAYIISMIDKGISNIAVTFVKRARPNAVPNKIK